MMLTLLLLVVFFVLSFPLLLLLFTSGSSAVVVVLSLLLPFTKETFTPPRLELLMFNKFGFSSCCLFDFSSSSSSTSGGLLLLQKGLFFLLLLLAVGSCKPRGILTLLEMGDNESLWSMFMVVSRCGSSRTTLLGRGNMSSR